MKEFGGYKEDSRKNSLNRLGSWAYRCVLIAPRMRETLNESKPFLNVMLSVNRNGKIIQSCFRVINQTHRGSGAF